jgi:5-carboxymethyl-2-hydroxymuconate isomerase
MPHIFLEFSSNLGDDASIAHLLDRVQEALGDSENFDSVENPAILNLRG